MGNFAAIKNRTVVGAMVSDWGARKPTQGSKPDPLPEKVEKLVQHKKAAIAWAPRSKSSSSTEIVEKPRGYAVQSQEQRPAPVDEFAEEKEVSDEELPDQLEEEEIDLNMNPFDYQEDQRIEQEVGEKEGRMRRVPLPADD